MSKPIRIALLSLVPFLVLNVIVALHVEPVISILRPDTHTSLLEQILFIIVALFLPLVGAFFAIKPVFSPIVRGEKNNYLLNCLLALFILIFSVSFAIAFSQEAHRCDIQHILNCD